ncbi:hypothetical protein G6F47_004716 [Rhizopus delemar]|nr:hypothetical protein G6F54_002668 [Rhizopus delemar]KAG1509353.1 hypothetical protein G6F53_007513 [Rhizopus delemar]KAG1600312.1 hypothetical protein G6F47_004716 [Rhizopus delemar]KAG1641522.1 hypothetical protein G6F44_005748 [Rhizopus delemar]
MRVLCVAEKPSAAKKIAEILSQSDYQTRQTQDPHVKNYSFTYNFNNRPTSFVMTSLKGHFLEMHFQGEIDRNWNMFPVEALFTTPIVKEIPKKMLPIANNIKSEVRSADVLFIWTDCDREGEAIGGDVKDLCQSVKPNIQIWRAQFSSMQPAAIHRAARNHVELDMKQVYAVNTRQELDLRIGAAFTRLQTKNLRSFFEQFGKKKMLSYGSCQFPTLGFVVDRYQQVKNFIPEEFWKITMTYSQSNVQPGEQRLTTEFNWKREHLFDQWACFILYEKCVEKRVATVTKVKSKQTSKWKPLPLTTVELQKVGCRALHMSGSRIMQIAEELYTAGLISYPRTETDQFDSNFDFMSLINQQTNDPRWGQYATLLRDGEFERPRNGKNNDKAHPPIHPTSYDRNLSGEKLKVYEFIARRFLGACWKNAVGYETSVEAKIDEEYFDAKGLVILERNYLEVYIYDKWTGNVIPEFQEGHEFIPETLEMKSGKTSPPKLLTETDLIGLMEKNEIGTDATIAEHIQKILDREYVYKEGQFFKPLTLGIALVLGYNEIGLESSLNKPYLRREMEADLKSICEGRKSPDEVSDRSLYLYRQMFLRVSTEFDKIKNAVIINYRGSEDDQHTAGRVSEGGLFGQGNNQGSRRSESARGTGSRGRGRGSRGGRGGSRGSASSTRGGLSNGSRNPRSNNNNPPSDCPNCRCGNPAIELTVTRDSGNRGRRFFACAAGRDTGCGFFEWIQ